MPSWATAAWEDFLIVHGRLSPTRPPGIPAGERTPFESQPPGRLAMHSARPCTGHQAYAREGPPVRGILSKEGKVLIPIQCPPLPKEKVMKHSWGRLSCSIMNPLPPPSLLRRSGYEGWKRLRVDAPSLLRRSSFGYEGRKRFNAQVRRQVSPRGRGEMD